MTTTDAAADTDNVDAKKMDDEAIPLSQAALNAGDTKRLPRKSLYFLECTGQLLILKNPNTQYYN